MSVRTAFALGLAAFAVPASAALWVEVDLLPGDISVELDAESVEQAMDGANVTLRASFRKQMPNAMMETMVAVDCNNQMAKIRGIRLTDGGAVLSETLYTQAEFGPVSFGSMEAVYLKALCNDVIPAPPMPELEPGELGDALGSHETLPDGATGESVLLEEPAADEAGE